MEKILLAGATGYLGGYILQQLINDGYQVTALTRHPSKLKTAGPGIKIIEGEPTNPASIAGCCRNIDTVISTIGITRQKEGFTYWQVDYQANLHLLEEARRNGVKKFIYISVLHGDKLQHLKICAAKEAFVRQLQSSGLDYCIIRPNGYFSDMGELYNMAQKGRIYLFGKGAYRINPIHGEDLAGICISMITSDKKEIAVGGPELLTHNEIADIAFQVAGRPKKITLIPVWIVKGGLFLLRIFTGSKVYGPLEFFITVFSMDMIAPRWGKHRLKTYFESLRSGKKI